MSITIYQVETDGSLVESTTTDAVLKTGHSIDNELAENVGRILDNYNSSLKLATFGDMPYGPIFFSLIENEVPSDLLPIEGGQVGG